MDHPLAADNLQEGRLAVALDEGQDKGHLQARIGPIGEGQDCQDRIIGLGEELAGPGRRR